MAAPVPSEINTIHTDTHGKEARLDHHVIKAIAAFVAFLCVEIFSGSRLP